MPAPARVRGRQALFPNSLFVKIAGLLLVLTVVPIFLAGQAVQNLNETVTRQQEQRLEKQAFALADTLAGRIKDAAEASVAEVYNASQLLASNYQQTAEPERESLLSQLFISSPRITDVAYAVQEGKIEEAVSRQQPTSGSPKIGDDVSEQLFFVSPITKQKVTSSIVLAPDRQFPRLILAFPVIKKEVKSSDKKTAVGVLIVTFDLNEEWPELISNKLNDPELTKNIRSYIVDNKGRLLAQTNNFLRPQNPTQFVRDDSVLKAMASGESQPAQRLSRPDVATGVKGIQAILAVKPVVYTATGEQAFDLGLVVVVQQPEEQAFNAVTAARQGAADQSNLVWLVTFIAAIVAVVVSVGAALTLIRPLRRLTQGARRIAAGELDTRVQVRSRDEIGELSEVFNLMAQKLLSANAVAESYLNPKAAEMVRRSFAEENAESLDGNTEEKVMTLFFSDIVAFTSSTEKLGPAGSIARLNAYYEVVSSLLQNQGGKIDKYVADEIVAIFEDGPDHAYQAVKAAVLTLEALELWNAESGFDMVRIRIGINTGECIVANIGSRAARRFDRTVIGDAVNTTQRLMTAGAPNSIVISEETYNLLGGRANVRLLEPLSLKGKAEKVAAYEVLGLNLKASPGLEVK